MAAVLASYVYDLISFICYLSRSCKHVLLRLLCLFNSDRLSYCAYCATILLTFLLDVIILCKCLVVLVVDFLRLGIVANERARSF